MADSEDNSTVFDGFDKFFGLSEIKRHRLVANNVDSCFDSRFGNFKMSVIGCRNAEEINLLIIRQCRLFLDEFGDRAIRSGVANVVRRSRCFCSLRIR